VGPAFRCVVVDLGSGSTGTTCCFVEGVNGVAMVRSGADVSFLDDWPTTTWLPLGPVKVVPAGPLCVADDVVLAVCGPGWGSQVHAPGSVGCVWAGAAAAIETTTVTARIRETTNSVRDGRQRRLPEADGLNRTRIPPLLLCFGALWALRGAGTPLGLRLGACASLSWGEAAPRHPSRQARAQARSGLLSCASRPVLVTGPCVSETEPASTPAR